MILARICTDRLAKRHSYVLKRRVHLLHILWIRQYLVDIWQLDLLEDALLDSEAVVQVRVSLRTSRKCLYLCVALALCEDVRI